MRIKAVLFDMDGVLIDAKDWHYESLNRALALFGMPISRVDHLTMFDGLPTRKKLEMLSLERGLPKELHEFINEMKQRYTMEIVNTRCNPKFTHEYALASLKSRGYKLAVCSNSVRASVDTMMLKAGLTKYLDLLISNEDVSKGKPDPEIYIKAMAKLNCHPQECLVVEDNENGIKAAQSTGAHILVVRNVLETNLNNIAEKIQRIELDCNEK
jgi:beta-phosphoglucomutase